MSTRRERGRPPEIWHGSIGWKFVEAVALAKYYHSRPISTPHAIRIVQRQREFACLRRYAPRYLQKQLLDAAEFWGVHPTFKELIGRSNRIYWLQQNQMKYWNIK
jgi:hypothetical protein